MSTFSIYQWARALALMGAGAFILCFFWGMLLTDPALKEIHLNSISIFLLGAGFVGTNIMTFIVGTVMSAIWGAVGGMTLVLCLNHCKPRT